MVDMSSPALTLLTERLLWPIPRVRWEAARSLARLIRENETAASYALLNWIRNRRLESEASIGLSVIDAFNLCAFFDYVDLATSIQSPSLLSNFLLKKNFNDAGGLTGAFLTISPSLPARLSMQEESWFDKYCETAVPRLFKNNLEYLQQSTGFPLLDWWKHDWCSLQSSDFRPEVTHPSFFTGVNRNHQGRFNRGQRELYISAYLRTLAFAMMNGLPFHRAEFYARYALPMNRGLADLEPVERPIWARHFPQYDFRRVKELAQELWESAKCNLRSGEDLLALRVIESGEYGFVDFDMVLVIGPRGFSSGPPEAKTQKDIWINEIPGEMAGTVDGSFDESVIAITCPTGMTQRICPEALGDVHIDMALNIRLASVNLFDTSAQVQCGPTDIRLETKSEVLSRWVHWYSDWEPMTHRDLISIVNSITTVSKSGLARLSASDSLEIARLVRVRRASKHEIDLDLEAETESFWL